MEVSYWRQRDRYYRLLGCKCGRCGAEYYPPVYLCRRCGSDALEGREMPKTGELVTYTELHEVMSAFRDQVPMLLGIIRLDNGVKVLGQIVDTASDQVKIGDRVTAVLRIVRQDGATGQIHYGYKFRRIGQ